MATVKQFCKEYSNRIDKLKDDYLRNLLTKKNGKMIERNDIENDELWDTKRIKYVEEKLY